MTDGDSPTTGFQIPDGATLLLVDDNALLRDALRRLLELEGISVVQAVDGEQAICEIERDDAQLDAVLTDLRMPVVSGSELIAVLLECRPELPVVAMSAWAELPPDFPPVVPILLKPFDDVELIRMLAPLMLRSQVLRRQALQACADAAESASLVERQLTIAKEQSAKNGDLREALRQLRQSLTRS